MVTSFTGFSATLKKKTHTRNVKLSCKSNALHPVFTLNRRQKMLFIGGITPLNPTKTAQLSNAHNKVILWHSRITEAIRNGCQIQLLVFLLYYFFPSWMHAFIVLLQTFRKCNVIYSRLDAAYFFRYTKAEKNGRDRGRKHRWKCCCKVKRMCLHIKRCL